MTALIRRHPFLAGLIAFFLVVTFFSSFAIVPETEQGIVIRFGKPVRIINRYVPGKPFGSPGAGIAWRIPFAESFTWIDKRVRDVDMEKQQVLSTDQLRLEVDAFARYRVVDPLRMYIAARSDMAPVRFNAASSLGSSCLLPRLKAIAALRPTRLTASKRAMVKCPTACL